MSEEQEQQMEADIVGAVGGGKMEGEIILDLNLASKNQSLGDGGDVPVVQDHLSKKSECDEDGNSNRSNSSRNKSDSPGSKKSSKRKRKNRRRREKKQAAAVQGAAKLERVLGSSKDEGTGTENEYSQNSEDVNKDGEDTETGTESETTCHDMEVDQDISSVCVEPSLTAVTSIPEDLGDSMMEIADYISSSGMNKEMGEPSVSAGAKREPTHSVETLLQIAKCRILSRILEPLSGAEENDDSINEDSFIPQDLNNQDEHASSKLVVPPCSPSSLHSVMSNMENSLERSNSVSPTRQKSGVMKNVHFDEGPPEIVPKDESEHVFQLRLNSEECSKNQNSGAMKNVHFDERPPEVHTASSYAQENGSEQIFELKLDPVASEKYNDQNVHSRKSSKEAIVLAENLAHTASATSSVASGASASSLLKGTGSSNEDFTESSYHYPSLETMNESSDTQNVTNKIDTESFRETIQIFKIQNPAEAKYIGNEVDSILTKSLDKFTDLMGRNSGEDYDNAPIFAPEQGNATSYEFASEKESESQANECSLESKEFECNSTQEDPTSAMNTTFTIESKNSDQEPTSVPAFRPFSPGEIMPQAIPDMVSDTESVGTTTSAALYLSMVPEEDETEDEVSSSQLSARLQQKPVRVPSQTVSSASTVIENVASVLVLPATPREVVETKIDIDTHDIISSTSGAVSETESAKDNEIKQEDVHYERNIAIANIPSSASSTKSSISSPPSQEKSFGTAAPSSRSRPSSWGNVESEQTESEYEAEEEENARAKQSVEVFTLHFLSTDAPPSENNLDSGNGDQPYFNNNRLNELIPASFGSPADNMAAIPQHRREKISGVETDTESECSWLPDRKESLLQVINERETFNNANGNFVEAKEEASGTKKSGKRGTKKRDEPLDADEENTGNDNQGCSCARCVIV